MRADGGIPADGLWGERPRFVLASSSPRREALLAGIGALAEVRPPGDVEPDGDPGNPAAGAETSALAKAHAVANGRTDGWVLGADTVVVLEGRVLGKPRSAGEAVEMLTRLSGRTHEVITGIALVDVRGKRTLCAHAVTEVTFRTLRPAEIDAYVRSGEPMDKAGAYGAQGPAGVFIAVSYTHLRAHET